MITLTFLKMTDKEIIERLAEFMGGKPLLITTGEGEHIEFHKYVPLGKQYKVIEFNPLTNWNHTWQLIVKLQEKGFYYELTNSYHSKPDSCRIWNREGVDVTEYGEQQESICNAILKVKWK